MAEPYPADGPVDRLADELSVVLLTYHCGHRLRHVLDALLGLGVPVIAVDNGSTDDTVAVLEARGVRVLALPHNIGAAARNAGLEAAQTPYVAFCDDDGWYERDGLVRAVEQLRRHDRLAVVNARIVVGPDAEPDPISDVMAASPVPDTVGVPGPVLLSFMAGAAVVRRAAFEAVGGYEPRLFLGGEEEELAMRLVKAGWALRYAPDVVMHHMPSVANARNLRAFGVRNTLWTSWLHRPVGSALRHTAFTLLDRPKNRDLARGVALALAGTPWVLRRRAPMPDGLDAQFRLLDAQRFAARRPLLTFREVYGAAAAAPAD